MLRCVTVTDSSLQRPNTTPKMSKDETSFSHGATTILIPIAQTLTNAAKFSIRKLSHSQPLCLHHFSKADARTKLFARTWQENQDDFDVSFRGVFQVDWIERVPGSA